MAAFADIADFVAPFDTVELNGSTYKVTGLSAAHILFIVRQHGSDLAPLYQEAVSGKLPANVQAAAATIGAGFDDLIALVVACGMGRPEAVDKTRQMPVATQLEAVDKIVKLTLVTEGGLGKVVEIISGALAATLPFLPRKTSTDG